MSPSAHSMLLDDVAGSSRAVGMEDGDASDSCMLDDHANSAERRCRRKGVVSVLSLVVVVLIGTLAFAYVDNVQLAPRTEEQTSAVKVLDESDPDMVDESDPDNTEDEVLEEKEKVLFCWSRMEVNISAEVALIRMQFRMGVSIWKCDGSAVISQSKMKLGTKKGKPVYTWANEAVVADMGSRDMEGVTTDSFLNTEVFLLAWDTLIYSGVLWEYKFCAKVDPDAVFFPDRLIARASPHADVPAYFPNCGKWGGQVLLYGSLEVFTVHALGLYKEHNAECKALPWQGWGEDYYMQHCMDTIGAVAIPDEGQVGDHRCIYSSCSDWTKVAFHDFKDPNDWYQCYQIATGEIRDEEVAWGRDFLG